MILACPACFNELSLFNWPLVDAVAALFAAWAVVTVATSRQPAGSGPQRTRSRGEMWLAVLGLAALAFGLLTISWRMWMVLLAVVWGGVLIARIGGALLGRRAPPLFAAACLALLLGSAAHAHWVHRSPEYNLDWLGRLPPHTRTNDRVARSLVAQAATTEPLAIRAFRDEWSPNNLSPNSYRLSILARVLQQMGTERSDAALRESLSWQPREEGAGPSNAALAAIVISFAANARATGFDALWTEYMSRRDQGAGSESELLIWRAGLFVCDPRRAADSLSESELIVAQDQRNYGYTREFENDLAAIVRERGTSALLSDESIRKLLGGIYPQIDMSRSHSPQ